MSNFYRWVFALRALLRPRLLVPSIKVDTIARLDFSALKRAGYTGVVLDRDNCLTIPHCDTLDAWTRCKSTFGKDNMLIVSNSAGSSDDPVGIQAESLAYNLQVPVFRHKYKKPACGEEIIRYFRHKQSQAPRLLIIGDRLLTDVLLSTTLPSPNDHLPIWTTRLWKTPDLALLRFIEQAILRLVLWRQNQTFRDGVIEQRARGETWLGKEGWIWWIRRWALRAIRREHIPPDPIPPQTNPLAKFVLPAPAVLPRRPTTGLGWTWHYSKILAKYAGKSTWVVAVWIWIGAPTAVAKTWALASRKIMGARARSAKRQVAPPAEAKSS
ncbi:unnamed protein product [Rhizoctonia solani]|uniref:Phosphatidylglycerophosphatase GEP4, mitochondrial n=1 Tax=Rhizoctonia solani TaxID=456999 RepID=A0A8H3BWR2_9AGAM|nr:unnamed protein product [Rhizoctonia solani]